MARGAAMMALLMVGSLLSTPPPPSDYQEAMERLAAHACFNVRNAPMPLIRELFNIEDEEGLPTGLLVAAACNERRYSLRHKCGDNGKSCGLVQFRRWAIDGIREVQLELVARLGRPIPKGDPRHDYQAAARFWSRRIVQGFARALEHCQPKRGRWAFRGYISRSDMVWAAAAVTAVRRPNATRTPRCAWRGKKSESHHWRIRRGWHKAASSVIRLAGSKAQ